MFLAFLFKFVWLIKFCVLQEMTAYKKRGKTNAGMPAAVPEPDDDDDEGAEEDDDE